MISPVLVFEMGLETNEKKNVMLFDDKANTKYFVFFKDEHLTLKM